MGVQDEESGKTTKSELETYRAKGTPSYWGTIRAKNKAGSTGGQCAEG